MNLQRNLSGFRCTKDHQILIPRQIDKNQSYLNKMNRDEENGARFEKREEMIYKYALVVL